MSPPRNLDMARERSPWSFMRALAEVEGVLFVVVGELWEEKKGFEMWEVTVRRGGGHTEWRAVGGGDAV